MQNEKNEVRQWLPLLRLHFVNYCNQAQEITFNKNKPQNRCVYKDMYLQI